MGPCKQILGGPGPPGPPYDRRPCQEDRVSRSWLSDPGMPRSHSIQNDKSLHDAIKHDIRHSDDRRESSSTDYQPRPCGRLRRSAGRTCPGRRRWVRWGHDDHHSAAAADCDTATHCHWLLLLQLLAMTSCTRTPLLSLCHPDAVVDVSACESPDVEHSSLYTDSLTADLHHEPNTLLCHRVPLPIIIIVTILYQCWHTTD